MHAPFSECAPSDLVHRPPVGRLRVLVTAPDPARPGGVGEYLRVLSLYLRDEVECFTIGSRSDRESMSASLIRMIRDSRRFAHALSNGGYDVVHLNPSIGMKALVRDGLLLLIAKAHRQKAVVFAHGWDSRCQTLLETYFSAPFRWVFGKADSFVVLAERFRRDLRSLGYAGPIFVVSAPLDSELFAAAAHVDPAPLKERPTFTILFLARVEKEKGIYEALDAYRLVKREHPHACLLVAGDGSALTGAQAYASGAGLTDITFVGHLSRERKYEAMRSADAYLFPSWSEGLPLSVLEAMSFGLPIVTTAVGGLRDFFEDGTMGFSAASADPHRLAGFLSRLISDPPLRARIGAFNRRYARTHFGGSQIAARFESIYRFAVGRGDETLFDSSGPAHL